MLIESADVDDRGETGVLCEPWKLNNAGGVRYSCPSSSSASWTAPNPPCLRHRRATRSAHSSTFTNRTAPASSIASGSVSCNTRTAGRVVWGISGGACVAMIRRELARYLESNRGLSSSVVGATQQCKTNSSSGIVISVRKLLKRTSEYEYNIPSRVRRQGWQSVRFQEPRFTTTCTERGMRIEGELGPEGVRGMTSGGFGFAWPA